MKMRRCPHCNSELLRVNEYDKMSPWACHNDYCILNIEAHRTNDAVENLVMLVRLAWLLVKTAAVLGAAALFIRWVMTW